MRDHLGVEPIPPELLLAGYPPGIQLAAERLRAVVLEAVRTQPSEFEPAGASSATRSRSRSDRATSPSSRRRVKHVHLGFEYGACMTDPDDLLQGTHLNLRKVRFLTSEPSDAIPSRVLVRYTREAARVSTMSRDERMGLELAPQLERSADSR